MLPDIEFPKSGDYRTGAEHDPLTFYMEALVESTRLDLLLGYFSSSAISVLALGFAKFISNGGRVRLIINHILSEQDKAAVLAGSTTSAAAYSFHVADYESLRRALDSYGHHFFDCIAWLIATKRVQIRAIKPKDRRGISHYKSGVFYDGENKVRFKGSCNFTASGLLENLEELAVTLSWKADPDAFAEYERTYNQLFDGQSDYAELISFDDIEAVIVRDYGGKDLDELLVNEQKLAAQKAGEIRSQTHQRAINKILQKIDTYLASPRFPYESGPRDYQRDAYQNWVGNDYKGIFAMATGTGKTITSLNCVLNEWAKTGQYQAVILVPTTVLVEQWTHEARKFNFREIITVSGQSKGWPAELGRITTQLSFGVGTSFIVIVTYKSFTKPAFQTYFKRLPKTTVLLADEAHNIASPSVAQLLDGVHLTKRIGLSATPRRVYDPEGSAHMEAFFHDSEPYTYNFSMERAIAEGILCQYYYFPHIVSLTPEEIVDYSEISAKLAKIYARTKGSDQAAKSVEMLLMQRKRIIHKAQGKLTAFETILNDIIAKREEIDYTLVYAPEGFYADTEIDEEAFSTMTEDNRIIDFYASIVRQVSPTTTITQYTSNSDDKELVLKQFEAGQINVLLSMKCLDEGVDIPRTEQAIFCSSTGNPRQFIQRRGRILRQHPDKGFAYIYDMVVIPRADPNSPTFQLERKLVQKELERVVHFAFMATNKYEAMNVFREVCAAYELNLDTIHTELSA
ncbi:DEAD/DEAH box helicase family protein [Fibrella aquatilis]|uniref:DEAD/DEAH box helicase family protein n=1 Tax=Fibrella aquatilis TaxID=2817059 RepID=A0A939K1Q1_9BACT|nr:DEAD/DEAH box helicase family protein [Fibrella aquatilis]MBO0933296.1 DEAD/DEAH box helicase family protein [Fibrella aquatilis]